jgi:hypothetical protein
MWWTDKGLFWIIKGGIKVTAMIALVPRIPTETFAALRHSSGKCHP